MASSTRPRTEPWIPELPDNPEAVMDTLTHFAAALPKMSVPQLMELSTSIAAKQQALAASSLTSEILGGRIRDFMGSIDSAVLRTRTAPDPRLARGRGSEDSRPSRQPVQRADPSRFAALGVGRRLTAMQQRLDRIERGEG
jgi:hypothetical protein